MTMRITLLAAATLLVGCAADEDTNRAVGELASDRIELSAEFNEAIVQIAAAEGDWVSAGDPLLRLDDARAQVRLADANAVYLQARARMDELIRGPRSEQITATRAMLEGAAQELQFRQSEANRVREVHSRGLAAADALDRAVAALDAAEASHKQRRAQLQELLAGTTVEELAQAEQQIAQAKAKLDAAAIDLEHHTIAAPVDGVVDSRLFETGERPGVGQPAIIMLGGIQPYARVYVPERLRVRIKAGTKATIYVDGLAEPIAGQVRWIASEAAFTPYFALTERDRGRLSYVAKVDIAEARERLPDGVPVEVEFLPD